MADNKTLYDKNGVHIHFVDKSDEVKKTLVGLSKTALRASGKVVRKHLRENIPVRTKRFKNHIGSWVMINYKTGQPTLQIGFYGWQRVKKKGKLPSNASPWWVEFGTRAHNITGRYMHFGNINFGQSVRHPGTRATNVLRDTVLNNIDEIREAQKQYLDEISEALEKAGMKVDKGDEFEDDD